MFLLWPFHGHNRNLSIVDSINVYYNDSSDESGYYNASIFKILMYYANLMLHKNHPMLLIVLYTGLIYIQRL
jgi:hypothetical protein